MCNFPTPTHFWVAAPFVEKLGRVRHEVLYYITFFTIVLHVIIIIFVVVVFIVCETRVAK